MLFTTLSTILAGACALAFATNDPASPAASAPAQGSPPPAAAPQEKAVAAAADAMDVIKKFIADQKIDTTTTGWKQKVPKPPQATFDPKKVYTWKLETTQGDIKIRLMPDVAPMHVSSTIYLTMLGFYDNVVFHRVIPGFMAQGGDPTGTGRGGPGYQYAGEFKPDVKHDKPGKLSMANAGPGTDGSQFFLTFVATPHLDGNHTVFGTIVEGGDTTMKELEKRGSPSGATKEPMSIKKATIEVTDAK